MQIILTAFDTLLTVLAGTIRISCHEGRYLSKGCPFLLFVYDRCPSLGEAILSVAKIADRSVCPSPLIETCSRLVSDLLFGKYIGDFFRNSKFLSHAPSSSVLFRFSFSCTNTLMASFNKR